MEITLWDPGSERLLNMCVCVSVRVYTHRQSRQGDLAVHPHVALHLPL